MLLLDVSLLAAGLLACEGSAQDPPLPQPRTGESAIELPLEKPDPLLKSLEQGLAYLARSQASVQGGSLPATVNEWHAPLGVTALSALAWMAGGSSLTRGPYSKELRKAIEYLLDHQAREGDRIGYFEDTEDAKSATHGHGLATLALSQAYQVSPKDPLGRRLHEALELAVRRIELSQGVDGGWYYDPHPATLHEGSVTVCLVWALRGARNVGIHVQEGVVARAIAYVRTLQAEDGGFMYARHQPDTSVGLTAGCLSALHGMGEYEGPVVDDAYAYIWRQLAARDVAKERGELVLPLWPYYERMYLAQALWQHPDPDVYWRWARREQRRVVGTQGRDGSWDDTRHAGNGDVIRGRFGPAYATAANCLFLAVPLSSLPIYTR